MGLLLWDDEAGDTPFSLFVWDDVYPAGRCAGAAVHDLEKLNGDKMENAKGVAKNLEAQTRLINAQAEEIELRNAREKKSTK